MVYCCAINCNHRLSAELRKTKGITFHRFPDAAKDGERRKRWLANLRRDDFTPNNKRVWICSQHFLQETFDRTGQITRLKPDAVPTLFDFPQHLQKNEKRRRPPLNRKATQQTSTDDAPETVGDSQQTAEPAASASVLCDHAYHVTESPRKLKRKLEIALEKNAVLSRKLKVEQTKKSKLRKTVQSLKTVVKTLKDKNLVTSQCAELLDSTFSGVPNDVMKRLLNKKNNKHCGEYTPELRSFAMTLNFYSAKAYRFVRKTFNLGLPHPAVIRKWYAAISGEPGFTKEVFQALQAKVISAERNQQQVCCGLMMDEMSIRKHVEWDGKKFRGFVDLGTGVDDDSVPPATDALVLMVVSLKDSWKVPCGYFLINGLSGQERANLVTTCLLKLADIGIKIQSLTCDGPSTHFTMLKCLGVQLEPLTPSFPHPSDQEHRVCVFLDACHMLKLVRNTLADQGELKTIDGDVIKWEFIKELHILQEKEGLRLGNKLRSAHIHWKKQKMKVNLAAQSLSSSVADAIVFCRDQLKLPQFVGSEATVKFIILFDHLFDILNSRNPLAKGFKAPLCATNFPHVNDFLSAAEQYIKSLTDKSAKPILMSKRKTGFLGFIVCLRSVRMLVAELLLSNPPPLKYLLTYKVSQDHLELFFGAVRSAGGFNNNPTATQFSAAYRRLLMRNQIEGGRGNCVPQDETTILETVEQETRHIDLDRRFKPQETDNESDERLLREWHEAGDLLDVEPLSEYKEAVISYIAGYVVRMVIRRLVCDECIDALFENENDIVTGAAQFSLVHFKNRGGLVLPAPSVISVCFETEKHFQRLLKESNNGLPKIGKLANAIAASVLDCCVEKNLFSSLDSHMLNSTPTTNHVVSLIKLCSESFIKIRLHHLGKQFTEKITGQKVRKQLSKLILFKHQ